ncbi:hypothetical protein [Xanthobacter tagetidis]|jgi:hypothetical protein|uniref:Uncharacterized protein n=1 Tax=Xanthobacter tagetidis TaxID=60216 RepID=A0A3L7AJW6_9HYPH|nr:hypothetical protein [Xanthobacter tagetidis]MBB6308945.1 hypothetical protein [Xanthobacter tagetidis]RLP80547.1 hypothetical protein D9R14_05730 [Xanthobacter tagetidis]
MALITYSPSGTGPGAIAKLVWAASQALLQAARDGQREAAEQIGMWLANTRPDPRCTPRVQRTIDRSLEIARARLGGAGPDFQPIQPDDGEAA